MGTETGIEWTHHTFNPWRGCTKVSPGCQHCYAETMSKRNPAVLGEWGPQGQRAIAAESYWRQPHKWNRAAQEAGERRRVFCGSLMDWLEDRPELDEPRAHLFKTISETPHLDWLLLTKRPQNWHALLQRAYECAVRAGNTDLSLWIDTWLHGSYPPNVWVGTSVENQQRADERIPLLLDIPARVRFLSCEPLLGPVDISRWLRSRQMSSSNSAMYRDFARIDWVIAGGESGPHARPMHPQWARSLRDECQQADVPFFFKQWGEWIAKPQIAEFDRARHHGLGGWVVRDEYRAACERAMQRNQWGALDIDGTYTATATTWNGRQCDPDDRYKVSIVRLGKKAAGRLLDDELWEEFPRVEVAQ
jgi:protein gp37